MAEKVVVLGAGPAGLMAALELQQNGRETVLVEKDDAVGGQSKTVAHKEFRFDFGPHAYHVKGDRIDTVIETFAPNITTDFIRQKLHLRNQLFTYPLVLGEMLRKLHPFTSIRMALDYLFATVGYALVPIRDVSFETWCSKRFGFALYHLCFGQYTQRIWGMHPCLLSPLLAAQKLHKLNLRDIIMKLFGFSGQEQATYWRKFYYPTDGMSTVWDAMADEFTRRGGILLRGTTLASFKRKGRRITHVAVTTGKNRDTIPCSAVVNTIPVEAAVAALKKSAPPGVQRAGASLRYRSLILANIIVDKPQVIKEHWVYLLDPRFKFNRFAEQKNMGSGCAPPDATALSFEICCDEGDALWRADETRMGELIAEEMRKTGFLAQFVFKDIHLMRLARAYPIYDIDFEKRVRDIFNYMGTIENFFLAGRQGLFINCDIHDAMETGLIAAEHVLGEIPAPAWYEKLSKYLSFKVAGE